MIVLITVAKIIGSHSAFIMSKYFIRATLGGTKKNARFSNKKLLILFTHSYFMSLILRKIVSKIIPMIHEGNFMPVSHTISSPKARQPKIIINWINMITLFFFAAKIVLSCILEVKLMQCYFEKKNPHF